MDPGTAVGASNACTRFWNKPDMWSLRPIFPAWAGMRRGIAGRDLARLDGIHRGSVPECIESPGDFGGPQPRRPGPEPGSQTAPEAIDALVYVCAMMLPDGMSRVLDRGFFSVPVVQFLQQESLPFLMPVMFRGRRAEKGQPPRGLQWIRRQKAGWYSHTMKNKKQEATISVCVGYRRHRHRKDGKQKTQKLLFAAWRVGGSPTEIRERYRTRFGIETSFRQMRQARIYTCTRNPHLRLFFVAVALILRNVWVWIHQTRLAEGVGDNLTLHLESLRFKRMLDWIVHEVVALFHDGSTLCVARPP